MKLTNLSLVAAAVCVFAQGAQAHGYHHHRYGYRQHASRHVLSQRYLEQTGYGSEESAGWNHGSDGGWRHWPSDSWSDSWSDSRHGWRSSVRAERVEYSGQQSADADAGFSQHRRFSRHRHGARFADGGGDRGDVAHYAERADYHGGYGARPAAWCGWEMRHLVGADPGPQYNLARNWAHWGRSGPAGVGAVVVWAHHVGKIVGRDGDGQWVIESGNDGHRVRTRPRSIAGAIAIRWGGTA